MPADPELIRSLDLLDYTWSDLRLAGSAVKRDEVERIIDGELVPNLKWEEHEEIDCHRRALMIMDEMLMMQTDIDRASMRRLVRAWDGVNRLMPRDGVPVLPHLDFTPPGPRDIDDLLDELFNRKSRDYPVKSPEDGFIRAALVHNGIIRIYPYDPGSEMIARAAMQYELRYAGLILTPVTATESDYNTIVGDAIRSGDDRDFADMLEMCARARLAALKGL